MPFSQSGGTSGSNSPGFEVGYDQITSGVNIASTTQATPTTIITCAAHTFDGAAVVATFFSPQVSYPTVANATIGIDLWEGATNLGEFSFTRTSSATQQFATVMGAFRFTPTAAAHTYLVQAYASSTTGTPNVGGGAGTAGAIMPCFIRFTKV